MWSMSVKANHQSKVTLFVGTAGDEDVIGVNCKGLLLLSGLLQSKDVNSCVLKLAEDQCLSAESL